MQEIFLLNSNILIFFSSLIYCQCIFNLTKIPMDEKMQVSIDVPYRETISRLFIFRFLWVYVLMFVMIPVAIYMCIIGFLHFWYMLILGKRSQGMWDVMKKVFVWMTQWQAYFNCVVDQRPGFWF